MVKPDAPYLADLHDMQEVPRTVPHSNLSDSSFTNTKFATWILLGTHPCFWCTYDHDYRSSPDHIMSYVPAFGYTVHKNDIEHEPHPCLKDLYSNRMVTFAVSSGKTGELLAELSGKGDFGFLVARGWDGGFVPLR